MSKSQLDKLVSRIVERFNLGMAFDAAAKDVLHWFGKMPDADLVYITTQAGKQTVGRL